MLIVAMDANFRLKSRLRNSAKQEPMLGLGMSYFVDNGPYADFIKDYVDQGEVCSRVLLNYVCDSRHNHRLVVVLGFRPCSTC